MESILLGNFILSQLQQLAISAGLLVFFGKWWQSISAEQSFAVGWLL